MSHAARRLLLVGPFPPPQGGVAVFCAALADHAEGAGLEVRRVDTLIGLRRGPRRGRVTTLLRPPRAAARLLAAWRRADVVHVHLAAGFGMLPGLLCRGAAALLGRRPLMLATFHSGEFAELPPRTLAALRFALRGFDGLTLPSPHLRPDPTGLPPLAALALPVELPRAAERRTLAPRFLLARTHEPFYRNDVALDAFARIHERLPEARLDVIGDGSQREAHAARCRALPEGTVRFLDPLSHAAFLARLPDYDLVLNPTPHESYGLTLYEAMGAGCVVISVASAAARAAVRDGDTGRLVPPDDPEAMARAALDALAHPQRSVALAAAARRAAAERSWSVLGPRWLALYDEPSP